MTGEVRESAVKAFDLSLQCVRLLVVTLGLMLKCNKLLYSVKQVALLSVQVFFCLFFVFGL